MAQFGRPDGDVTNTGNNGFGDIDEASASDADFWYGDNNQADELEVSLSDVTDPTSSSDHIFRYRIAKTNAGTVDGTGNAVTVTARLMQGTTQIATDTAKTATGTWTQYSYTLTSGEADAITDYTDLRLEFVTSSSGGSPANRRGGAVSWAEFEVPDALIPVNTTYVIPFDSAVGLTQTAQASYESTTILARAVQAGYESGLGIAGTYVASFESNLGVDKLFDAMPWEADETEVEVPITSPRVIVTRPYSGNLRW